MRFRRRRPRTEWARVGFAVAALLFTVGSGTAGYVAFGFGLHEAVYQTVITVTTVGFQEVRPLGRDERTFTMVLGGWSFIGYLGGWRCRGWGSWSGILRVAGIERVGLGSGPDVGSRCRSG